MARKILVKRWHLILIESALTDIGSPPPRPSKGVVFFSFYSQPFRLLGDAGIPSVLGAPVRLFRRPSHRSSVIRTSIPRPFRVHTKFGRERGAVTARRKGTSACFASRRTICLQRGRGQGERSSRLRFTLLARLPFPPSSRCPLPASSCSYVPNEAARWIGLSVENAPLPPSPRRAPCPSLFIFCLLFAFFSFAFRRVPRSNRSTVLPGQVICARRQRIPSLPFRTSLSPSPEKLVSLPRPG